MKWRWVAIGLVVAAACSLLFAGATSPPSFGFISKLHGKRISSPFKTQSVLIRSPGLGEPEYYGFAVPAHEVISEMTAECKNLTKVRALPRSFGPTAEIYIALGKGSVLVRQDDIPKEFQCVVCVNRATSWLGRQWLAVRGWFHR